MIIRTVGTEYSTIRYSYSVLYQKPNIFVIQYSTHFQNLQYLVEFYYSWRRDNTDLRALLPHIPGVTGDGQLINLSLKENVSLLCMILLWVIKLELLMGKNVKNKITEIVIKNTFG